MQTTIRLDGALLAQAGKLAREQGCDLSQFIGETLREEIASETPLDPQPFHRLATVGGEGVCAGVNLDNSAALLALMEQGA